MADHYAVLGVQPDADRAAIQAAYRMLARLHHPDFGGDGSRMAALNADPEIQHIKTVPGTDAAREAAQIPGNKVT